MSRRTVALLSLCMCACTCMYVFTKKYARTATTEADNKRNIHENIFLKFFVLVITHYCSHDQLRVPCVGP